MIKENLDSLDVALEILKLLLSGDDVSKKNNVYLFEKHRYNSDVEEMLSYVSEKLDLKIYSEKDKLYICPKAGSGLFGWTNKELREKIKYVTTNKELYTGYFIIMTLITLFYKETCPETPISYVKTSSLREAVSEKFNSLLENENIEEISKENQFDFVSICKVWERLPDAREDVSRGKNDKVSFVETICDFLQDEKLVFIENKNIYPTDRFKTIIWNYYEDRDNRKELLSFIKELGGND